MAEDTTPSSSVLSTPQATANLDDVLASLEKQMPAPEAAPAMQAAPAIIEPVSQQIEAVTTPEPVIQTPATPEPIDPITPFQIEEAPIQSGTTVSAPVAEALPTPDHVQDHPAMEVSAPALEVPPVSETPAPSQPASKPGLFGRFSFNPKFAIGALVVALIAIGAVGTYTSYFAPQGSLDTRKHACTWVTTGCGSGCSDNQDLFKPECVGGGGVSNSTPPPGSNQGSCSNGWVKGTIGCIGAEQYSCTLNPGLLKIGCCPGAAGDSCRGTTTGTGTGPTSTTCGSSGQACCDPFTHSGLICSANLFCNTATGTCQAAIPGNVCAASGGAPSGQCEVYTCGSSCNNGNQCNLNKRTVDCASATLGGQCGQIDYLNTSGQYCGVKSQNCGGSCAGGTTTPSTTPPTATATPAPKCGSACTTNANCPTGLTCSAGLCRNAACTTSTTCTCTVATPTPTPTPTVAPTPTPTPPPLVCLNITKDVDVPVIGSQVRFTCGTVSGATSYEFRYKYTVTGAADVEGSISANQNVSDPLVVSTAAAYRVQCRPCVGLACTEWEAW